MELKKKIVRGFTHSYLRMERKIAVDNLRSGRINRNEWSEYVNELEKTTEEYLSNELDSHNFLKKRSHITNRIRKAGKKKSEGLTREEARSLYEPVRSRHHELLMEAHRESTPITEILYRTVSNKFKLTFTEFRNL